MTTCHSCLALVACLLAPIQTVAAKPDILFIAIDDLNDWIGPLGGHPQANTPNIDRLAERGMTFANAHVTAPPCNPSRVSDQRDAAVVLRRLAQQPRLAGSSSAARQARAPTLPADQRLPDAIGRAAGLHVARLLGGYRDRLKVYRTCVFPGKPGTEP